MRFDLGLVLGIAFECLFMIYYANTTFYPKSNYLKSSLIAVCGYFVMFWVNSFDIPLLAITAFCVINYFLFLCLYDVSRKDAIYSSLLLNILSIISEYIILFIMGIKYNLMKPTKISPSQSLILTVSSKLIYLICLIIIRHINKKQHSYNNDTDVILITVPVSVIACLTIMMYMEIENSVFIIVCVALLFINIITFVVNETIRIKNAELRLLREEQTKNQMQAAEYSMLSQQYENMRIMKHDFKKQLDTLAAMICCDNDEAKAFVKNLTNEHLGTRYEKYTNNSVLNVLLNQKQKECYKQGIQLHIHSAYSDFDFISDTDTVAIFSNLIDNAMEACEHSVKKDIFLDLYAINNVFPSIKTENFSDIEPKMINGSLITGKRDKELHGLGTKSIQRSVKNYNGTVEHFYDKDSKLFRTVIAFYP